MGFLPDDIIFPIKQQMQKRTFFSFFWLFFAKALALGTQCYMKVTFALLEQALTLFPILRLQPGAHKYRAGENSFLTGHSSSTAPLRRPCILILSPWSRKLGFKGICPGAGLGGPKSEIHWVPTNSVIQFQPSGTDPLSPRSTYYIQSG